MNIPTQHGKKIMYAGLLLLFAAFFLFDPNLTRTLHIVDAKVSIDKVIREGNLVASLPVSPQRGDIVVYESENKLWARRLIGLPGDVIGVADGGIYIDGKPIDTTFLAKAGPILPAFNNYRVPPNRVIVGTGNTGTFKLIEIDKPNEMRYGELIFSASRLNREVFLSLLVGTGYLFLLVFGPLFVESWLDPTERLYRVLKVSWYGLWLLALVVVLSAPFIKEGWNFGPWRSIQIGLIALEVRFTSLLTYFGASLRQSEIVSLIISLSGLAAFARWLLERWHNAKLEKLMPTIDRKKLRTAIVQAFPKPSSLEQILAEDMTPPRNLSALVTLQAPYDYQVYELITRAVEEGWIEDFLNAALDERKDNEAFVANVRAIAEQINARNAASRIAGTESKSEAGGLL